MTQCRLIFLIAALAAAAALSGCTGRVAPTAAPPTASPATPASTATSAPAQRASASPTAAVAPSPLPTATVTLRPQAPAPAASATGAASPARLTVSATAPAAAPAGVRASPAPTPADIIVDNRGFGASGHWYTGDGGQSYGGDCAWAPRGFQNIAYVRADLPLAGTYEIFAWWCGDPNGDQTDRLRVAIHPTVGQIAPWQVDANPRENTGQWVSLGSFYLERSASMSISGDMYWNIAVDAFRFAYREAERVEITPTPLPTRVIWTNHPPTPLEQLTTGDLMARVGTYLRPAMTVEEVVFDDCEAFPRDGCGGTRNGWRVAAQYQEVTARYRVSADYRLAAIEPSEALARRQVLYLTASLGQSSLQVVRYPDDTWHLLAALGDGGAYYVPLTPQFAALVDELRSLAAAYGPIDMPAVDGRRLRLLGLGPGVALSLEDQRRLDALDASLWGLVGP